MRLSELLLSIEPRKKSAATRLVIPADDSNTVVLEPADAVGLDPGDFIVDSGVGRS